MTRKMMNQLTTTQQIVLLIMMSFVISISGQNNNPTKQVNARIKLVLTYHFISNFNINSWFYNYTNHKMGKCGIISTILCLLY